MSVTHLPTPSQPRPDPWAQWSAVVCHSHMLRSHAVSFEQAKSDLVAWCRQNGIDALGVGSPWEPVSADHYRHYEQVERDLYYSGQVDPQSVMDREAIDQLFVDLNRMSGGDTLFYQDNETPKGRMGHVWYLGYHYDVPAWHDYGQDRPIQFYDGDPKCEINALTGQPHRRRCALEIIATQRHAGALAVWAHPTSWWWQGERFVTNIAAEIVLHLLADGRLDGMVVQGYDAFHRHYQSLWFRLLDTGAVVPGFAESDGCFDSGTLSESDPPFRTCLPLARPLSVPGLVAAARSGRMFATSGPFLTLDVDGTPMGKVTPTARGARHVLRVEATPAQGERQLGRLEIIGTGGTVLDSVDSFAGGTLEFAMDGSDTHAYVLVRAFGEFDDPQASHQGRVKHMAITNPVYLHPPGYAFTPARTECTFTFGTNSPWRGGSIAFQNADGSSIDSHRVTAEPLTITLPASARACLSKDDRSRTFYVAMENRRVQDLLRYLHDGEFLEDYAGLQPGEVPADAFRVQDMAEALSHVTITL